MERLRAGQRRIRDAGARIRSRVLGRWRGIGWCLWRVKRPPDWAIGG